MDPGFQPGEIIDVTMHGLQIDSIDEVGIAQCSLTAHAWRPTINLRAQGVKVERVIPADGEPQPGELWADRVGALYFVIPYDGRTKLVSEQRSTYLHVAWEDVHRGPTGPIYRVAARPLIGGQS